MRTRATRNPGKLTNALLLCIVSLYPGLSRASTYILETSVVNNGGEQSGSAGFSVSSSIGQAFVGPSMQTPGYSVLGGYLPVPDSDGDTWKDYFDNCISTPNIDQLDTDGDYQGNACDLDDDNDLLSDFDEMLLGTDPLLVDTDGDGLTDFDEVNMDNDPATYTAGIDTDPNNPDTDGDGIPDGADPWPHIALAAPDGDLAPLGNPDGNINAADLAIAQRIALGTITPTELEFAHGDVYPPGVPDGVIDTSDLVLIQQLVFDQP